MFIPGMRRAAVGLTALAVAAFGAVATNPEQADAGPKPVDVQLLAINRLPRQPRAADGLGPGSQP